MADGSYYRRAYLTPELLTELIHIPHEARLKTVAWQDTRQAFMLLLEMPATEEYFVGPSDLIPELGVKGIVTEDTDGNRTARFEWEEIRSEERATK